jgi:O-antigen/teichoic acid export membrane protein
MEASSGMASSRQLLLSAATNWFGFVLQIVIAFFIAPYLIHKLGDSTYGIWGFVESILAYLTLFDMGVAACVVRYVARHHSLSEQDALNRLVSTASGLFLVLGAAVVLVGLVLLPTFLPTLARSELTRFDGIAFYCLMLVNLGLTLPLGIYPAMLDGLSRFQTKTIIRTLFLGVRTIGTIYLMESKPNLLNLGIWHVATNLLEHLVMGLFVHLHLPLLRIRRGNLDRSTFQEIRGYSLDAFLAMLAGRLSLQSGPLIIGWMLPVTYVTWFLIPSRLLEFAKALLRSVTSILTPAVSQLQARGETLRLRDLYRKASRLSLYLILPIQLGLIIYGGSFIQLWLKDVAYRERCETVLIILSLSLPLVVMQSVASRILYGLGEIRRFSRVSLVQGVITVVGSAIALPYLGIEGVAGIYMLLDSVFCIWAIREAARALEMPIREYLIAALISPVLSVFPLLLIWVGSDRLIDGWIDFIEIMLMGVIPYMVMVFLMERAWPRWCFRRQHALGTET